MFVYWVHLHNSEIRDYVRSIKFMDFEIFTPNKKITNKDSFVYDETGTPIELKPENNKQKQQIKLFKGWM